MPSSGIVNSVTADAHPAAIGQRDPLNHDAFAERLERFKPDWTALAEVFAKAGLTDRRGNPPTGEAARKTWQRVRIVAATEQTRPPPPDAPQAGTRTVQLRGGDGTPYNPKK